jgi:hypothetical protein
MDLFKRALPISFITIGIVFSACSAPPDENAANATTAAARYDGKMVKHDGSDPQDVNIYLVSGGKKHPLPSMDWFVTHDKNTADVLHISKQELDAIPIGDVAK